MVTQTLQSAVDIRKFVVDATSVPDATVSSANAQGNFQTIASALQWVDYNNLFTNIVDVRGQFILATDPGLNATNSVVLNGGTSASSMTFNTVLTLNNVTFENLILNFTQEVSFGNNVFFNNCVISFGVSGTPSGTTVLDIVFDNCELTFTTSFLLPLGVEIKNSSVTLIGPITLYGNNTVDNCNFAGAISRFVVLNGNNIDITYCNFASSNNPVSDGTYTSANLVNTGNAVIYNNISLSNVNINNCNFTSILLDRYPYISFEFNAVTTSVQDIIIRDNNFTQINTMGDDIRAAVVFSSNIISQVTTFPFLPKLVNVVMTRNICNHDQSILVTSIRNGININGSLLAIDNVIISENICGTIGFITGFDTPANFTNNINGKIQDKFGSLQIKSNSCKFITNIDNFGKFIPFIGSNFPTYNTTAYVSVTTGPFTITDNSCNWIQVGSQISLLPSEGGIITNNRLYSVNPAFLSNFSDPNTGITPGNTAILIGQGVATTDNIIYNIVSGNIIKGVNTSDNTGAVTFNVYGCAIACFDNATLTSNNINGAVTSSSSSPILYIGPNGNVTVRNNTFSRNGQTIQGYVVGPGGVTTSSVAITDNYFDSVYLDEANSIENTNGGSIPANWVFEQNVNQIGYVSINARYLQPSGSSTTVTVGGAALTGAMLSVGFATNNTDQAFIALTTLNTVIPAQSQLLQVALGTTVTNGLANINTADTNNFGFYLGQQFYAGFSLTSPPVGLISTLADNFSNGGPSGNWTSTTIPNPYNSSTNYVTVNSSNIAAWGGSPPESLFAYLDVSGDYLFANRGQSLDLFVFITVSTNSGGAAAVQLSPILIKYKW